MSKGQIVQLLCTVLSVLLMLPAWVSCVAFGAAIAVAQRDAVNHDDPAALRAVEPYAATLAGDYLGPIMLALGGAIVLAIVAVCAGVVVRRSQTNEAARSRGRTRQSGRLWEAAVPIFVLAVALLTSAALVVLAMESADAFWYWPI